MKKLKNLMKKLMLVLMMVTIGIPCILNQEVQAAGMSDKRAEKLYSSTLCGWITHPKQVSITDDLRARSGYSYNDTGKMVYIHKSYCSDMSKWIRKDLNADGTPEYLTYLPNGQMLILTIYNNRVRVLAVLQTGWGGPDVYYNKKTNTFTVVSRINARTISRNVYKIRNGKLYRIATLSDYVGMVMNINGYQPIYRYLNGKKVSKTKYYRYYNKYCTGMQHIEWNASQG